MSEREISDFDEELTAAITELKDQNKIAEIDLVWLFSYIVEKYSIQKYINNQQNILKLLKKISWRLLILKHGIENRTRALNIFGDVKERVITPFNAKIKRRRTLFNDLANNLSKIVKEEILGIVVELTKNKMKENLDLISLILKIDELSVKGEYEYKIPIKGVEFLKNITFLDDSHRNPEEFTFYREEQYYEIENLPMGTLNYLANHILEKKYEVKNFQTQITYKLTNSIANQLLTGNKLTARREHVFRFWEISDELIKLGMGYWYPYFTKMNDSRYSHQINVNFIIPSFVFDIINEIRDALPEIDHFQERLESFDSTKRTIGSALNFEVSHDQIKDFIADNPDTLEDGLIIMGKEYKTGEVGNIDILFKSKEDDFLIIEVKKGIARYEPVGQILGYIKWVKENLLEQGEKVRGKIICEEIHPQLRSAFMEENNPDIQVWVYEKQEDGFNFKKALEIAGKRCPFCGRVCSPRAAKCPNCGEPF